MIASTANISPDGQYRYYLSREWHAGGVVCFVMLNPSTADAHKDDATIRKCVAFAKTWGYGGIQVVNLFALRATSPRDLMRAADPVGPNNDEWIRSATNQGTADKVVLAWGNDGAHRGRGDYVKNLIRNNRRSVHFLKLNTSGQPAHPLYLRGTLQPIAYPQL